MKLFEDRSLHLGEPRCGPVKASAQHVCVVFPVPVRDVNEDHHLLHGLDDGVWEESFDFHQVLLEERFERGMVFPETRLVLDSPAGQALCEVEQLRVVVLHLGGSVFRNTCQ